MLEGGEDDTVTVLFCVADLDIDLRVNEREDYV